MHPDRHSAIGKTGQAPSEPRRAFDPIRLSIWYCRRSSRTGPEVLVRGITTMSRISRIAGALCLASVSVLSNQPSYAQANPGVERLYIPNCGEGAGGRP
jgi:hypothetical protein